MRWGAKPEKGFRDTETMAQEEGEKNEFREPIIDDLLKIED